jgi:ClpP class serine protease
MPSDPMVLDASAINDAGEFEMMLFDNDTWDSSQEHQRQLQAKVEAYMEVARTRAENNDKKVRITVVGMYQPDADGQKFMSQLRSMVESAGIAFKYDFRAVSDSDW